MSRSIARFGILVALGAMIAVGATVASAQPAPPPPANGALVNNGCADNIRDILVAKFAPAAMQCVKLDEPAPTDENPKATALKLVIDVGWKDAHIRLKATADGKIEDVTCPAAIVQAVAKRYGAPARDLTQPPAPAIKCMPGDAPEQLRVEVPGKAFAQVHLSGKFISVVAGNDDVLESGSALMALLFWAFAAATIGGALFVITRRNLIAAVMGMVGSFMGIAAVYMMLYAQFLAVIQMLVYAGAIMVLFVFVIMILNRPEDEPIAPSGRAGQTVGIVAILYLVFRLAMLLIHVKAPNGDAALAAPAPLEIPKPGIGFHDWGSLKAVGTDLFGAGLFPFETISILLLIAVVGAIAIARPLKDDEP